jgi:hypothetical protein
MNTQYNLLFFYSLENILFTSQNTEEIILTAAKLIFLSLVAEHEHILNCCFSFRVKRLQIYTKNQ